MIEGRKIAFVGSSGGMRCSHGAGARFALEEQFGIKYPDIDVNTSGNINNSVYGLSGQTYKGRNIWMTLPKPESGFIKITHKEGVFPLSLDVSLLVNKIFKVDNPPDLETFRRTKTQFRYALTDMEAGKTRFFRNEDIFEDGVDIYKVMEGGSAIPGMVRPVRIQGRFYRDGAETTSIEDGVDCALKEGADIVIVIDNRTDMEQEEFHPSKTGKDIIHIKSTESMAQMVTLDPEAVGQSFNAGYWNAADNMRLQELLVGKKRRIPGGVSYKPPVETEPRAAA